MDRCNDAGDEPYDSGGALLVKAPSMGDTAGSERFQEIQLMFDPWLRGKDMSFLLKCYTLP